MLGVVMAVAHQTGGTDHAEFMRRFSARIQSLAAGQDLLVDSQWRGVQLDTLARAQLAHFKDLIGERISLSGPLALLSPSAVQTIGMALHELATNASKYGALSTDRGRVTIEWQRVQDDASDRFVLNWTESDGPTVFAPKRRGFGSTVTGNMVRMSLDGEVTSEFAASGFSWRLDCPSENVVDLSALAVAVTEVC
jgi:two-component sensor histidine kinase